MEVIKVQHTTAYHFSEPVTLLPHLLMLRPREGRNLRVISSEFIVAPDKVLSWSARGSRSPLFNHDIS